MDGQPLQTYLASTTGKDEFSLVDALQWFSEDYWIAEGVSDADAASIILDAFKRKIAGQLEMLDLKVKA